ncbi:MAG: DUF433 domain-containing protein [Bryobacteraceae bacterium]|jgi:hypothetical protein
MTSAVEIGSLIDRDPAIRGGRPKIAGTGVTVMRVAAWYKMGAGRKGGSSVTNLQLYLSIGVPMLFNAVLIGVLMVHMDKRFDDMRELWRAELRRVEEVLDARLKHLEEH